LSSLMLMKKNEPQGSDQKIQEQHPADGDRSGQEHQEQPRVSHGKRQYPGDDQQHTVSTQDGELFPEPRPGTGMEGAGRAELRDGGPGRTQTRRDGESMGSGGVAG